MTAEFEGITGDSRYRTVGDSKAGWRFGFVGVQGSWTPVYGDMGEATGTCLLYTSAYTLDSLYRDFTADSIRIYFFQDKIELATAPKIPTEFLNYSGDGSGYAVYQQESTNESDWTVPGTSVTMVTKPSFLYLRKIIGDEIDPIGKEFDSTAEQLKEQDISVKCQTTGIICTKTGTILHVLDNSCLLYTSRCV